MYATDDESAESGRTASSAERDGSTGPKDVLPVQAVTQDSIESAGQSDPVGMPVREVDTTRDESPAKPDTLRKADVPAPVVTPAGQSATSATSADSISTPTGVTPATPATTPAKNVPDNVPAKNVPATPSKNTKQPSVPAPKPKVTPKKESVPAPKVVPITPQTPSLPDYPLGSEGDEDD